MWNAEKAKDQEGTRHQSSYSLRDVVSRGIVEEGRFMGGHRLSWGGLTTEVRSCSKFAW